VKAAFSHIGPSIFLVLLVGVFCVYPQERGKLAPICFQEVAAQSGLQFVLENSPTPEKRLIETMPGGVAAFDFDGDGRTDIFFTNGAEVPSLQKNSMRYSNRLFHNEGNLKFRDVTAGSGLSGDGYSMGVAIADFDNDGKADIFVAGVQQNKLYRNVGNGKFEDVTARAGIKSDQWSVAAGWLDFDNDGQLDLFVINYGAWNVDANRFCGDQSLGLRVYCHPKYFEPRPNQLYRNRGDGTFEDVSEKSGIAKHHGRGMSVAFADYDNDGLLDAFVTNDNHPNFLFHNLGKGHFEEVALQAGVALLDHGKAVASMGTDFRDYDNDGLPDIVVTALNGETFPIFHNDGHGSFHDATYSTHVAKLSASHSGWAVGWYDFNNDGWKDLFSANSHVNDLVEKVEAAVYKQSNTIFTNLGNGVFTETSCPELGKTRKAHRGASFADLDGDGKIDVVASSLGEPAELWHNVTDHAGHWLNVKLRGTKSNRDGIGASLRIGSQVNQMTSASGYASSTYAGVHFGLGTQSTVQKLEIFWPSGRRQTLENVKSDRVITVEEP
jgi:hypothetical protein